MAKTDKEWPKASIRKEWLEASIREESHIKMYPLPCEVVSHVASLSLIAIWAGHGRKEDLRQQFIKEVDIIYVTVMPHVYV